MKNEQLLKLTFSKKRVYVVEPVFATPMWTLAAKKADEGCRVCSVLPGMEIVN